MLKFQKKRFFVVYAPGIGELRRLVDIFSIFTHLYALRAHTIYALRARASKSTGTNVYEHVKGIFTHISTIF